MVLSEQQLNWSELPQTPIRNTSHNIEQPTTPWTNPHSHIPSYPASLSINSTPAHYVPPPYQRPSRAGAKRPVDENGSPFPGPSRKRVKPPEVELTVQQKLDKFFDFIANELKWSYGDVLYHTSCYSYIRSKSGASSRRNAAMLQHFFHGRGTFTTAHILHNWLHHPYGRDGRLSPLMFTSDTPYNKIGPVRPAITSFATQIVAKRMSLEAEEAVKLSSGLHVSVSSKDSPDMLISWPNIGSATFEHTKNIIKKLQPLTWALVINTAVRRKKNIMTRKTRPPENVRCFKCACYI